MRMKPSFWSGQAAHMTHTGHVLSSHPPGPASLKVERGYRRASSQKRWQVFVTLLGDSGFCALCPLPLHLGPQLWGKGGRSGPCSPALFVPADSMDESIRAPLLPGLPSLPYKMSSSLFPSFPGGTNGKEPVHQCRRHKRRGYNPWVGKIPWKRAWKPTPVVLPGESHGQTSLVGDNPWGHKEADMTEAT